MKHSGFHRIIVAIAMMLIGWLPSLAHDFEVDGVFYNKLNSSEVAVTYKGYSYDSYSGEYAGDVVIPSSVNYNGATYSVTSIGNYAFEYCPSLTSIEIANSVTSIGYEAFRYCSSLTSIVIPNSVTSIGYNAFYNCSSLTSIEIGNSVTSIGDSAFWYCSSLTSIEIPNSVTSIGDYAFLGCSNLTSVVIGNSVTSIGNNAFYGCSSLTSIEIPNSVTSIEYNAFYECTSLTSIEIPNSVTTIGDGAFSGCESLTSIVVDAGNTKYDSRNECNAIIETASNTLIAGCKNTIIPNSVTSIGNEAFRYCSSLTSIEIPNSVTSIGNYAFEGCKSLTSIEIANSVTSIGYYAFSGCLRLTSIEIPNSVTSIGGWAFYYCESLTSVVIGNSVTSIGYEAFYRCTNLTSVVIGNSVTSIGDYAFLDCYSLTSIEIPNSVTSIGNYAFSGCKSLTSIVIPNSVTSIGNYAFRGCSSLTSIEIPNSVTSIGNYAFQYCSSLTSIEIPNSVTSIGNYAFNGCSSLTKITCLATTPPKIVSNTFSNYSAELHVPSGCKSAYQSANFWKNFNIKEIVTLSTSIALNQATATLKATETITLVATVLPENATDKSVTWKSSNEAVATVDANGKVTAVAVGEATITATTADGSNLSASCKVTVTSTLATSITLDYTEYEIVEKSDFQLTATILPESTTNKGVGWSSSDMRIASVDENGLVRAYSVGEAVITATTIDGSNLSASCKVTVVSSLAQSITLDKTEVSLKATETTTLVATVLPETTSNKSVEWKSSNEAVATVNNKGEVTAIAVGEATITATTADGSNLFASCTVTVVPTLAESIALDKTEISLEATETATLVTTVLPELTTDKSVKWSSSNEAVATVDANGKVTAVAVGEATITATTADGSNKSATCKITVAKTPATSISLDKTSATLKATEILTLKATIAPATTTDKSVTWKSSNEAVATVDANGKVTAVAVGEATITATTADGSNKSATCKITVAKTLASSISLDKTSATLKATETLTLKATVAPATTTDKSVTWKSSNEAVATVDANGKVTAVAVGEATITATTADGSNKSATCKVTVTSTLATSITLDYTEYEMVEKAEFQLTATILPESTKNKGVVWSSSDAWVASVDENGLVRAYSVGEAVITATTIDGSNLSASCKVIVVSSLAQSITLDKTEVSLEVTETAALVATVLPKLASNKSVEWSSSNEAIAVVDENGVVTAISIGEAVITATTADGSNLSASCKVSVIPTLAVSIELDQTEASVEEKSEFQLTATILPEYATNKEVAWSSSKKVIATVVDTGLVFVKSVDEVVITATTTDDSNLSASCYINVYSSGIDGVEGDNLIVATIGDNIVVKNAKIDSIVRVYAADGSIISSEVATDGDVVVEAPIKGVYIVSVNGKTFKVMVK